MLFCLCLSHSHSQWHARAPCLVSRGRHALARFKPNGSTNLEGAAQAAAQPRSSPVSSFTPAAAAAAGRKRLQNLDGIDVRAGGAAQTSAGKKRQQQHQQQPRGGRGVTQARAASSTEALIHPDDLRAAHGLSSSNTQVILQHLEQQALKEPCVVWPPSDTDAAPSPAPTTLRQPPRLHLGRRHVAALDFDRMYQQLAEFKRAHLTAHVPRHCWDAPELGAWVRQLRKEHKERRLEQWKVDRLNLLGFQWQLTEQDAKWHYAYHQLRRYKAVHGTTAIPADFYDRQDKEWVMVTRWLEVQGRAIAKRKLPLQHQRMLARLGVTLTVPRALVHRYARLQVTNAHERKLLRRAWRQHDRDKAAAQAAAAAAARAAAQQQLFQEEQELLWRQDLLQDSLQGRGPIPEHLQQEMQRLQQEVQGLQQRQQQLQEQPVRRISLWWKFRRLKPKLRRRIILRLTSGSRRRVPPGAPAAAAAAAAPPRQQHKPRLQQQQQGEASKHGVFSNTLGVTLYGSWPLLGSPQAAACPGLASTQEAATVAAHATTAGAEPPKTLQARVAGRGLQSGQPGPPVAHAAARAAGDAGWHQQQQHQHQHQRALPQVDGTRGSLQNEPAGNLQERPSRRPGAAVPQEGRLGPGGKHQQRQQDCQEEQQLPERLPLVPVEAVHAAVHVEVLIDSSGSISGGGDNSSSSGGDVNGSGDSGDSGGAEAAGTIADAGGSSGSWSGTAGGVADAAMAAPAGALYEQWWSPKRRRQSKQELAQRLLEQQQVGGG